MMYMHIGFPVVCLEDVMPARNQHVLAGLQSAICYTLILGSLQQYASWLELNIISS